jgi:hypothetical protein
MDARSYLEIGVFKGKTFNNVTFDRKVGVDPRFGFEVKEFERAGTDFLAVTSDEYFLRHAGSERFDIIFLDGLHTFQQTFRDFCNSLTCAHERTVWLIDDVLPVDVYSAWPIASEARTFRAKAGGDSKAWHGDVYKLMFVIHDFFPTLTYVTMVTTGNPQAMVWKTPRKDFAPILGSLEAIERLTYFDLLKRDKVLNKMSEEEGFQFMFASLRGNFTTQSHLAAAQAQAAKV